MNIDDITQEESLLSPDHKSPERRAISLGVFLSLPTVLGLVNAQGNFISKGGRWIALSEWVHNKFRLLSKEAFNQDVNMSGNKALKLLRERQSSFSGIKEEFEYRQAKQRLKNLETRQKLATQDATVQSKVFTWLHQSDSEWMDTVRPKSAKAFSTPLEVSDFINDISGKPMNRSISGDIIDMDTIEETWSVLGKQKSKPRIDPWSVTESTAVRLTMLDGRTVTGVLKPGAIKRIHGELTGHRSLMKYLASTNFTERNRILRAAIEDLNIPTSYDPLRPMSNWVSPDHTLNQILEDPNNINMDALNHLIDRDPAIGAKLLSKVKHHVSKFKATGSIFRKELKERELSKWVLSRNRDISEAYTELQQAGIFNPHGVHAKGSSVFHSDTPTEKIKQLLDDPHTGLGLQERQIALSVGEYSELHLKDQARYASQGMSQLYESAFSTSAQSQAISNMVKAYDVEIQQYRNFAMELFSKHQAGDVAATEQLQFLATKIRDSAIIKSDSITDYMKFVKNMKVSGRFDSVLRGRMPFKSFILDIAIGDTPASISIPLSQFGLNSLSRKTRIANTFSTVFMSAETQSGAVEASIQAVQKMTLLASKHINDLKDSNFKTMKFDQVFNRIWGEYREKMSPTEGTLKDFITGGKLYSEKLGVLGGDEYDSFYRYMARGIQGLKTARRIDQTGVPVVAMDFEFGSGIADKTLGLQKSIMSAQNKVHWMAYNIRVGDKEMLFDHFIRPDNWFTAEENIKSFYVNHQGVTGFKNWETIDRSMKGAKEQFDLNPRLKLTGAMVDGNKVYGTIGGYVNMAKNIYNNTNSAVNFMGHNVIEADLAILNKELKELVLGIEQGLFDGVDNPKLDTKGEEYKLLKKMMIDTKPETLLAKGRVLDTMTMTRALLGEQKSSLRFGLQDIYDTLMTMSVSSESRLSKTAGREAWNEAMLNAVKIGDKVQQKTLLEELPSSVKGQLGRFIKEQPKAAVLNFFDGGHHAPSYDTKLSMLISDMALDNFDKLERDYPEQFYKILALGQTAERHLESGGSFSWHHRISSRTEYDLLKVDDDVSGDVLRSNLFSMTPVQATKGVGSIWNLAKQLPFGRLSNFQKQKYQDFTEKFTDAHFVEKTAYDALKEAKVPDTFPVIGRRMVTTEALEQQNEMFSKIWGSVAGTMTDAAGKITGGTRRLRSSFPVYAMFLPTGDRLVVEDQGLFTSKKVMQGAFNFGKGASQPISVKTPQAGQLMKPENFDRVTGMSLNDYMDSLGYDDRIINMINDTGAGNIKMSSFIEGTPMPVYSHQQAIDMLTQTTKSHGVLEPGQMFLKGESEKAFDLDGEALIRMQARVKNKLKYNSVITDVSFQRESGDLIFNVLAADKPSIVKLKTANKASKGMIAGYAANEFVGKGVSLIVGWKGDAAAMLDTQIRRALEVLHKSGKSIYEQRQVLTNIFSKAFNLSEGDVAKAVAFDEVMVHKGQGQYFGAEGKILIPRLKDQSLLKLHHDNVFNNIRIILEEAGVTYGEVKKKFKRMFTDVSSELGVQFESAEIDRLANLLANEQKRQINQQVKLLTKAQVGKPDTVTRWLLESQKAIKNNTALFDIGATVQKSQLRSFITKHINSDKVTRGLGKTDTVSFVTTGDQLSDLPDWFDPKPFAFLVPTEASVMEDMTDFGRLKGAATDIWGNKVESSSSIWQMMMYKQAHQNNPVFMKTFLQHMLDDAGWNDPRIVNQLKSNYFALGSLHNTYQGGMEGNALEVITRELTPWHPVGDESPRMAMYRAMKEDVELFNTIMGQIDDPDILKKLGNIGDIAPGNMKEIIQILKDNGLDSEALRLAGSLADMQGRTLRTFSANPKDIFNIFKHATDTSAGGAFDSAEVLRVIIPEFSDMLENSGAKSLLLKELERSQIIQTSKARFARQVYTTLYNQGSEREKEIMKLSTAKKIRDGIIPAGLYDEHPDLTKLPKEFLGQLDELLFSNQGVELPTFLAEEKKFMLTGTSYNKLEILRRIVNTNEQLVSIASEIGENGVTAAEAARSFEQIYIDDVDEMAAIFARTSPVAIASGIHRANKFNNPAYYGKAIDASTIMTQGFGSFLNKVDASKELLSENLKLDSKLLKYLGDEKVTYKQLLKNYLGTNINNATDLSGAMYRNINGKRFLVPKGTGLFEGIMSHSEFMRQAGISDFHDIDTRSPLYKITQDSKSLQKVLSGEEFVYSKVMREPSFPSPVGAIMRKVAVLPDEVFEAMGINKQSTLGSTFINRLEINAMLGDFDGDLVKEQFMNAAKLQNIIDPSTGEPFTNWRAAREFIDEGYKSQAQNIQRFINIKLAEEGGDALSAGWDNPAVHAEYGGRWLSLADPKGLDDSSFMKFIKQLDDPKMFDMLQTRAETYSVMQALTPRIGQMTKKVQSLFSGEEPGMVKYLGMIEEQLTGDIGVVKNFLANEGFDIVGKSEAGVRQMANVQLEKYAGAWAVVNQASDVAYKNFKTGLVEIEKMGWSNSDQFISWMSQGITQKGPIHKAKGSSLPGFVDWATHVSRFMEGTMDEGAAEDLIQYFTSDRNTIEGTRYDRVGLGEGLQAGERDIIEASLRKNAQSNLGAVLKLLHGVNVLQAGSPLSEPFEMAKKTPNAIYGWSTDMFGDDIFIKPEISRLISPATRSMIDSADSAGYALFNAITTEGSEKRIVSENFSRSMSKAFSKIVANKWGSRLGIAAAALTIFDPHTNSILLPDQQYDGEKYDIPNLDEVAQSYKNRFRARAENDATFLDKMSTLSGLPLSQLQRPATRPGVPRRPIRPIYNIQSGRSYNYSSLNNLKRRLGNIET